MGKSTLVAIIVSISGYRSSIKWGKALCAPQLSDAFLTGGSLHSGNGGDSLVKDGRDDVFAVQV